MATKPVFLGATTTRVGESGSVSLSIPTEALLLGQKMGFLKSTEIPLGYTSISSIQLRYISTGTGNLYLKFAISHTSQTTGSTTTEDVDSYTVYAAGTSGKVVNVVVPASSYNGLTGMVAGDTLSLGGYRDDSVATDTYTSDLEVVGFLIIFSTGASPETGDGDRSKNILGKTLLTLTGNIDKSSKATFKIPESAIYDIIGDYATKIAQELYCLETSSVLTVTSSATSEPTGFLKLKQIVLGTDLYIQPVELDVSDYDILTRNSYVDPVQTPLYYKRWAGTITFFPAVASDSYTTYWYTLPTTVPSSTVDPETPAQYDKAIEYGVISEVAIMAGRNDIADRYNERYLRELDTIAINRSRTDTVPLEILYNGKNTFVNNALEH